MSKKEKLERIKSEVHDVYTEEINKIALSNNDDKRLQTFLYNYIISIWYKCRKSMQNRVARISK